MSLSFSAAIASLALGTTVKVSNGLPEPTKQGSGAWRMWRSHNFTGELVDKVSNAPRSMVFRLPQEGAARVSYTIIEGLGHSFEAVTG